MEKDCNTYYDGCMVYADVDKTQVGLRIAIDHGLWFNKAEDFILFEGLIPKDIGHIEDEKMRKLFESIKDKKYFMVITKDWTETLDSEEYKENLKKKRAS